MRLYYSSTLRMVMAVLGVVAPSLFFASSASGSPLLDHSKRQRIACDGRATAQRILARRLRTTADRIVPRANPSRVSRSSPKAQASDDDEAIQSDSLAIGVEPERLPIDLQAFGLLIARPTSLPRPQRFSRRSPRGPPALS